MPELPEVEIVCRELDKHVAGKAIEEVAYDSSKMLRPSAELFRGGVVGKEIVSVSRRAKLIVFSLSPKAFITCHLKLSGRLFFRKTGTVPDDYVHVVVKFSDDTELRFSEARKFGYMELFESEEKLKGKLDKYGPEPLEDLTLEKFKEILGSTRKRIKSLLMDQQRIAGVGNIYANDALWMAKVDPLSAANQLSADAVKNLYHSLKAVLEEAISLGGASDQWYLHPDGSPGSYQDNFRVYSKEGEPCPRCGDKIEYSKVGGRGTFVCPSCQTNA